MAGTDRLYPSIEPYDVKPPQLGDAAAAEARVCDQPVRWDEEPKEGTHIFEQATKDNPDRNNAAGSLGVLNVDECNSKMTTTKESGENIYFDCPPLREQTGIWVPPSVPPMTKNDHEEWEMGFGSNGGYFAKEEYKWDIDEEIKEMTMWDVLAEMVVAGKDKVLSIASYDFGRHSISLISHFLLQAALEDKAQTLAEASIGSELALLETEPTKWLPDSASPSCMLCGTRFHPIICSHHHCRFCGGIFCGSCSKGRSLMPPKFRTADPQRVWDVCGVRLECIQPYLMNQTSRACQLPTNDLTDLSTLRSWINSPWAYRMEYEIGCKFHIWLL